LKATKSRVLHLTEIVDVTRMLADIVAIFTLMIDRQVHSSIAVTWLDCC